MLKEIPCVLLTGGKSRRMGQDKCFLPLNTLIQNNISNSFNENSQSNELLNTIDLNLANLNLQNLDLIHYQVTRLKPYFKDVFISCKQDKFQGEFKLILDEMVTEIDLKSAHSNNINSKDKNIKNASNTPQSPLLALYSILNSFKKGPVFVLAVDMPMLALKEIEILYKAFEMANLEPLKPFENLNSSSKPPLNPPKKVGASLAKTASHTHFLCGFYEASFNHLALEILKQNKHSIKEFAKLCEPVFTHFDRDLDFINLNEIKDYESFLQNFSNQDILYQALQEMPNLKPTSLLKPAIKTKDEI